MTIDEKLALLQTQLLSISDDFADKEGQRNVASFYLAQSAYHLVRSIRIMQSEGETGYFKEKLDIAKENLDYVHKHVQNGSEK